MATLQIDLHELEPLIRRVAAEIVAELREQIQTPAPRPERLLHSEMQVADLLGVSAYFLKEKRQQGFIHAHTAKKPILYTWEQVLAIKEWLAERHLAELD